MRFVGMHEITYLVLFLVAVFGGHFVVRLLMKKFVAEGLPKGFSEAGKWIGILERFLFWIFLTIGQASLIGFLLTIKAIYRFGDIQGDNEQKMRLSEYFIIGSLLSLSWSILLWGVWLLTRDYVVSTW